MRIKLVAIICAAFGIGASAALLLRSYSGNQLSSAIKTQTIGKAQIGGPFSLVDHTGRRVSEKDFRGKYMLVFFGYTYCPDVCPTELQVMASALDQIGEKADEVIPVFVTIDPERDTVSQLGSYVTNFHKNLVGLTGSKEEIRAMTKTFRVYYRKSQGQDGQEDYLMDHSSIIYLFDKQGEYVDHFTYGTGAQKIANKLLEYL